MIRTNSPEAQAHEHTRTHTHACTQSPQTSFQWGSIWCPTSSNFLLLKANKDRQGAYFPCLVNMYHCPISNVDTRRHPGKSTVLPPSLAELALMLLSGVLYLPPRQSARYRESVCVTVTSAARYQRWVFAAAKHINRTDVRPGKEELCTKWGERETQTFLVKCIPPTYERILWGFGRESVLIWWAGWNML